MQTKNTKTFFKESVVDSQNKSQIKAATKVNEEMLEFYFWLGGEIPQGLKEKGTEGNSLYQRLSNDLVSEFPDVKSLLSVTNLKYMQYFFELYPESTARGLWK